MEKNRSTKVIAIAALLIAIIGLSVGFAAFSNVLKIQSSAQVTPSDSTFNVDLSAASDSESTSVTPTVSDSTKVKADVATIDNSSDPTISGLAATFTEPGQTATYSFYARNIGEYEAFLKSIEYANVNNASSFKVCTAGTGTTQSLVDAACEGISVSVQVGSETAVTTTKTDFTKHSLAKEASEPIVVTISYTGTNRADGDFTVAFGDITLTYSSTDN